MQKQNKITFINKTEGNNSRWRKKNKYIQIKSSYLYNKSIHYASRHKQRDEQKPILNMCTDYILITS